MYKIVMTFAGLLLGLIITRLCFFVMKVQSDNMSPSLGRGDIILISRLAHPSMGDIVAFNSPVEDGKIIIGRVIAKEFDTVEIRDKRVFVNGNALNLQQMPDASAIFPMSFSFRDNMPPVKLNKGEYFLLGDNFNSSFDSRALGPVSSKLIEGRVIYTYKK